MNTCSRGKAQENVCERVKIGFSSLLIGSQSGVNFFKPITSVIARYCKAKVDSMLLALGGRGGGGADFDLLALLTFPPSFISSCFYPIRVGGGPRPLP